MKLITLFVMFAILVGGCARKSELERTRADLTEAQRTIEVLENERVPRNQYDITRASLKIADERITHLERELKAAQERLAAQERASPSGDHASESNSADGQERPTALGLVKGEYERANETYVYSPDAQLNFGRHLQISSPTGLMVSDPEQKIVGGDLSIKANGMSLESSDGLLTTTEDGSVKFVGKTLTMKFDDKKAAPEETAERSPPSTVSSEPAPAVPAPAAAATSVP